MQEKLKLIFTLQKSQFIFKKDETKWHYAMYSAHFMSQLGDQIPDMIPTIKC